MNFWTNPVLKVQHDSTTWWATGRTPSGGFLAFAPTRQQLIQRVDAVAESQDWGGWREATTDGKEGT